MLRYCTGLQARCYGRNRSHFTSASYKDFSSLWPSRPANLVTSLPGDLHTFDPQITKYCLYWVKKKGILFEALNKKRSGLNMIYSLHKQHFQSGVRMGERWHTFWTHVFREDVRSSVEESVDLAPPHAVWLIVWYFYMWKTYTLLMCWACFALLWRWETVPCVDLLTPRSPYGHPRKASSSFFFFTFFKCQTHSEVRSWWKIRQKNKI